MSWMLLILAPLSIWVVILLLPWRPWGTRESLDTAGCEDPDPLTEVTVLIPARNEAHVIDKTLAGVRAQGPGVKVLVVDDQSTDDTAQVATRAGYPSLRVIKGQPPPREWSGKLWALEQGRKHVRSDWVLLLDADIELAPGILQTLINRAKTDHLQFISLMAELRMHGFWEYLLMPAFIYFFKLLYPFRLSNTPSSRVAAAAGGCILTRTRVLSELGGFKPIKDALIDDCALARRVKLSGFKTWIGLSHSVKSLRTYDGLREIGHMVVRTAFYQLRYSVALLFLLTLVMLMVFWVPVAGLGFPSIWANILSGLALAAMMTSYLPTLRFYRLPMRWAGALPLIGTLYLIMTWISAVRFWQGTGARWKGRAYGVRDG